MPLWSIAKFLHHYWGVSESFSIVQHADLTTPIAIALGAIPGALSRYYITVALAQRWGTNFPFGTFVINISGAFLMGYFATLALHQFTTVIPLQRFLLTGLLGSYTTFSTYALDTSILLRSGSHIKALLYWAGSACLGGLSLELGIVLASVVDSG